MKPRLILHIGMNRAGSTALQKFFANAASHLASLGILYPTSGFKPLSKTDPAFAHNVLSTGSDDEIQDFAVALRHQSEGFRCVVLSSESLWQFHSSKLGELFDLFRVVPIAIVREHLDFLRSWWAYDTFHGFSTAGLNQFLWFNRDLSIIGHLSNWPGVRVLPWDSSLVAHREILSLAGLNAKEINFALANFVPSEPMNPSIGGNLLWAKLVCNSLYFGERASDSQKVFDFLGATSKRFWAKTLIESRLADFLTDGFRDDRNKLAKIHHISLRPGVSGPGRAFIDESALGKDLDYFARLVEKRFPEQRGIFENLKASLPAEGESKQF